jgi:hypothetical protein
VVRESSFRILILVGAAAASAHGPITTKLTWSRDISRIIYNRCASCHREGGAGPMSLLTYEEARPWAKAIQEEVLERRMPPWGAVKGFGDFQDELGLTQEEIHLLSDWVDGGAPEGDPKLLPEVPRFNGASPKPSGAGTIVHGALTLARPLKLASIAPHKMSKGSTLRVIARLPDSSIEPLLWIYQFNPKFARTYRYRSAVALPKGTRIEVIPPGSGSVALSTVSP